MYKNVLLMKNGCDGCCKDACLGVLLAESMNARVTAAYVTGDFTWRELRNIYGMDELKWPGAARAGREAKAVAEERKILQAKEALASTEKMCADRGIPCETVHVMSGSPLRGVLKVAVEKQCDMIFTSIPQLTKPLFGVKRGNVNGGLKIPVLFHHAE